MGHRTLGDTDKMPKDLAAHNAARQEAWRTGVHEGRMREREDLVHLLAKAAGDQYVWENQDIATALRAYARNLRDCPVENDSHVAL